MTVEGITVTWQSEATMRESLAADIALLVDEVLPTDLQIRKDWKEPKNPQEPISMSRSIVVIFKSVPTPA